MLARKAGGFQCEWRTGFSTEGDSNHVTFLFAAGRLYNGGEAVGGFV